MSLENCLKNKVVLVTGAGQGIGRALTKRLHSYGAKVYAVSRSKGPLDSLAEECPNIIPIKLDIGHSWDETRKTVLEMKDLDIVINNAGIVDYVKLFLEATEQEYDALFDVNLKAIVNISQAAAQNMIAEKRKGTIINISSTLALRALDLCSFYCTSKAGLDMLTKCMALELGKHSIRVSSMNLGLIKTTAIDNLIATGKEEEVRRICGSILSKVCYGGGDFLPMDEVLNTILFAASDLAPTLTGSCILHDGGFAL